jgi:hypothetical protein
MSTQRAIPEHRVSSRPISKAATLDHYKAQLLASQYSEAVLLRRISAANTYLQALGIRINPDPWSDVGMTIDGDRIPVAPVV